MVLAMASQDAQNFFQPLSSWLSRVYEALQQAGDALSASLVLLSKHDSALSDKPDQDLEDTKIQETYYEDEEQGNDGNSEEANSLFLGEDHFSCSNSDLQDSSRMASPRLDQQAKDSCSIIHQWPNQIPAGPKPPHMLSSIAEEERHFERQTCGLQLGFDTQLPGPLEKVNGKKQGKPFSTLCFHILLETLYSPFGFALKYHIELTSSLPLIHPPSWLLIER